MANTFKNVLVANLPTTATTHYTTPAFTTTVVIGFTISNKNSVNEIHVNANIVRSGGTPKVALISNVPIPPQSTLSPLDGKIVLQAGDYIEAWSDSASVSDLHLSIMEMA